MNIVVCIKRVPDTDGLLAIDTKTRSIDDRHLPYVVNHYDEIAVEEAVQLRERCGSGQVTVVSMGDASAEEALRSCLAAGADRAVLLCDPAFNGSDSYATGVILARAISSVEYDLVLCGMRAADTNAGQVGAVVAELLGIPLVSAVAKIEVSADQRGITVQRKVERGDREIVASGLPALLTIQVGHKPRYPSLSARMAAQRQDIDRCDAAMLGFPPCAVGAAAAKTVVRGITPPKPKARKLFAPATNLSPAERMRLLMSGGIQERTSNSLEGDPKEVASKLVEFLRSERLLPEEEDTQ